MTKKYIVMPGPIASRYDGDFHYISFSQLCHLYQVDPREEPTFGEADQCATKYRK